MRVCRSDRYLEIGLVHLPAHRYRAVTALSNPCRQTRPRSGVGHDSCPLEITYRLLSCRVSAASTVEDDRCEYDETEHGTENASDPDPDQFGGAEEVRNTEQDEDEILTLLDPMESVPEGGLVHTELE